MKEGYKYWGFRDFSMEVKACPIGCVYCNNNNEKECLIWKMMEADWIN